MVAKQSAFGKPSANEEVFEFEVQESASLQIPSGPYPGKCTRIVQENSKSSNQPMFTWDFVITKGPYAGRDFRLWTSLSAAAAWKLNETLRAFGIEGTPGQKLKFTKSDVLNVMVTLNIEDSEYQGQPTSRIASLSAPPEGAGAKAKGGLVTPATTPAAAKKKAEPVEPEEPEGEEPEAEGGEEATVDLDAMDRTALKAFIKEQGLDVRVVKSMEDEEIRDAIRALFPDDDAEEPTGDEEPEAEEPEEAEEPAPAPARRSSAPAAAPTGGRAPSRLGAKK